MTSDGGQRGCPRRFGPVQPDRVEVEKVLYLTTPMPIVHISLECTTPTAHADGAFRTLVAVTEAELRDGAHLREAGRRASIVGFGGPHRVLASWQLYPITME